MEKLAAGWKLSEKCLETLHSKDKCERSEDKYEQSKTNLTGSIQKEKKRSKHRKDKNKHIVAGQSETMCDFFIWEKKEAFFKTVN